MILVNAYIVYVRVCKSEDVKEKNILSHHDFRMKVAMAWINPDIYYTNKKVDLGPHIGRREKQQHQ